MRVAINNKKFVLYINLGLGFATLQFDPSVAVAQIPLLQKLGHLKSENFSSPQTTPVLFLGSVR